MMSKVLKNKEVNLNCSYLPPELFAAAGFNSGRLWPEGIGNKGQGLLPYDFCPYSRAFLSMVAGSQDLSLFANSCDAMRRVYDALAEEYAYLLEVPRVTTQPGYFQYQLEKLLTYLGIDPENRQFRESLRENIKLYNYRRKLLKRLLENLIGGAGPSFSLLIEGVKYYYQQQTEKIAGLVSDTRLKQDEEGYVSNHSDQRIPRVIISSSCLLDGRLVKLVEESGLRIVGLDSCLGERSFNFQIELKEDNPLESLARGYLNKPACPRTMEPKRRVAEVKRLITSRDADGLIYFMPKFCDQAGYDFKFLKENARENNFPLLLVEGEYQAGESGQLNTRITAFRESLERIK